MLIRLLLFITAMTFTISNGHAQKHEPFAVLELFTSQGCSSCPAADDNISAWLKEREKRGVPVYLLSFHVDYWDRLGWKDTFGEAEFSQRQRTYASVLNSSRVYTPQLIVNGESAFVGSSKGKTRSEVELALLSPAKVGVEINARQKDEMLQLDIQLDGAYSGKRLCVALVEHGIPVEILRGENRGRQIIYNAVVREWKTIAAESKVSLAMRIPAGVNREKAEVVVFVQDLANYHILGAGAAEW